MVDYHAEVALVPNTPKVVMYYPAEDGEKLIMLYWMHGDESFAVQVGDEEPQFIPVHSSLNLYLTMAQMAEWIEEWCDKNEHND